MFGGSGSFPDGTRSRSRHSRPYFTRNPIAQIPDTALAAVVYAAAPESTKQISANTAAIRKWVSQHTAVAVIDYII